MVLKTAKGNWERRSSCVRCTHGKENGRYVKRAEYLEQYKTANPEKVRQHHQKWYQKNKAAINEKRKALRIANPDAVRAAARAYYARRRSAQQQ